MSDKTLRPVKGRLLVTTTTAAATGSSSYIVMPADVVGGKFYLRVTAASGTTPTLDVSIKTTLDDGTAPVDTVCWRFAQATTAADRELTTVWGMSADASTSLSAERAVLAATGGALALPTPINDKIKVTWTIGGTNPSFTFALYFVPWKQASY